MIGNIGPSMDHPGGTISTAPTFNSTLREPTAKPPQPGPFVPPSGLAVLCRPLTTWPSMNAVKAGASVSVGKFAAVTEFGQRLDGRLVVRQVEPSDQHLTDCPMQGRR